MKEIITFCFAKLKAKENQFSPKSSGGGRLFCGEFRSLLPKLMFTHAASCLSCRYGVMET